MNSKSKMEIHIVEPFLAVILAEHKEFYERIDEIYYQDEELYLNAFEEDVYNDVSMASNGSIIHNEYYRKAVSIFLAGDEDKLIELEGMIEKIYPFITKYFDKNPDLEVFKLEDFLSAINKKILSSKYESYEVMNIISYAIYICEISGIEIDEKQLDYYNKMANNLLHITTDHYKLILNEDRKRIKLILKKLKDDKSIHRTNFFLFTPITPNEMVDDDTFFIRKEYLDNDMRRVFEPFINIIEMHEIDLNRIFKKRLFSDRDLSIILKQYLQHNRSRFDIENYEEIRNWLLPAVYIAYLAKAYKEADEYIRSNSNRKLIKRMNNVNNQNKELSTKNNILVNSNKDFAAENERLKKANENLKRELEKFNDERKELISLRNFMFSLNNKEEFYNDKTSLDELIKDLNEEEIIIIGGYPGWIDKLRELLKCRFVGADILNFDINLIKDKKVILNTDYLSHAMYYKVIENINKAEDMFFISNVSNIELSIRKIHSCIFNK